MNDIRTRNAVISQGLLGTPNLFDVHLEDLSIVPDGASYSVVLESTFEPTYVWRNVVCASDPAPNAGNPLEPMRILLEHCDGLAPSWNALDADACKIIRGSHGTMRRVHKSVHFADPDRRWVICDGNVHADVKPSSSALIFAVCSGVLAEVSSKAEYGNETDSSEPLCPRSLGMLFLQRHAVPYAPEPDDNAPNPTDDSQSGAVDLSSKALGRLFLGNRYRRRGLRR